ncbi:MAG: hypothetical protein ACOZF0_16675 [Thermodesulfobacteriota bacterium]
MAASLSDCTVTELTEDRIMLRIRTNAFNAGMIQQKKALFDETATARFGRRMDCRFEIETPKTAENGNAQNGQLKEEALRHPLVAQAVELFEGKVIDVKIL